MNSKGKFVCAGILLALLATATVLAVPIYSGPVVASAQELAPASQTASGKVLSVSGDSFSLEVRSGGSSQTLRFVTDANTKVQGKLEAGVKAAVDYTTDANGKNLATNVIVQST